MIGAFVHILFVVVLGATLMSTPPEGTWQLELYNFECESIDMIEAETYYIQSAHLIFDTVDRGYLKYRKRDIKEIHGIIIGQEGAYIAKYPLYQIEQEGIENESVCC